MFRSDRNDLSCRQFGDWMTLPDRHETAIRSLLHILFMSAAVYMERIEAWGIVALMKGFHPLRKWAIRSFECFSVGILYLAVDKCLTVACTGSGERPEHAHIIGPIGHKLLDEFNGLGKIFSSAHRGILS